MDIKNSKLIHFVGIPLIIAAYLALWVTTRDSVVIIRSVALIIFGYIAAYNDFTTRKVPNKLILAMLAVWAVIMSVYIVVSIESAIDLLIQSLISGVSAGGLFLLIYLVSRKGVGGGDVKLIAVMGLFLTFAKLMPMLFFSSLLAALASAVLLLTKRATIKTAVPLVPFLFLGAMITIFL